MTKISGRKSNLQSLYIHNGRKKRNILIYYKLFLNNTLKHKVITQCHKNFTAVPANVGCVTHVNLSPTSTLTRSQRESSASTSASSGILPPLCIFCGINCKRNEKLGSNETRSAESRIREVAHQLGDILLFSKVGDYMFGEGPDFVALEVKYHHSCKRDYLNKIKHTSSSKHTIMKDKAFKFVVNHIRRSIIKADQPELATSVMQRYIDAFVSNGGDVDDIQDYTVQSLCRRIKTVFDENELVIAADGKKSTVFYKNSGISLKSAMSSAAEEVKSGKSIIRGCASLLRNEILTLESTPFQSSMTVNDIMGGEVKIPENLKYFYQKLYTGDDDMDATLNPKKQRLIESSSADAVFACSGSKKLPGKHIGLGLAIKSMTGSRNVVTLLNRYGHCASIETLRRVDMGLEEGIIKNRSSSYVPNGILKVKGLCTGLAWDNFDINMQTFSYII